MSTRPQKFGHVLVVGAGTLGQVYGAHLAVHGVEVTYLVRQSSRAPSQIRIRNKSARRDIVLDAPRTLTRATLRGKIFDAIFIATRTQDLPDVISTLIESFKKIPPVFILCPVWGEAQIPQREALGELYYFMPGVVAYAVDDVQVYRAGVSRIGPMGKARERTGKDMAYLVQASGLPCRYDSKLLRKITQPSLALIVIFALIEIYHGQFKKIRLSSQALKSGISGMKEVVALMGEKWGVKNLPLEAAFKLPQPFLRLLVWGALKILPRFYREMLSIHAEKISPQTRLMMDEVLRELGDHQKLREFEKFVLLLRKAK